MREGRIRGRVWLFGDSIDTNQLAGVPGATTLEQYRAGCLAGVRPEFPLEARRGDIIVAGSNFGAGSSRQAAVEVLQFMGIGAVVAESFARIFFRTSVALAFPVFTSPGIQRMVTDGDVLEVDYGNRMILNVRTLATAPLRPYAPTIERIYEHGGLARYIAERLRSEDGAEDNLNNAPSAID
jgi:3-isopropylmalate/(R)-2-methylmalate dehydratase small subunit